MIKKLEKMFDNCWLELAVRWILGITFVYASYHKIVAPAHFAKVIYGYYLFPYFSINLIAIVLPYLELFCGLALILGIYPRSAALIVNAMLLAFIAALSINLIRGQEFDCGCFSFTEQGYSHSALQMLIRDIVYLMLGLQVLFFKQNRKWCLFQSGSLFKNIQSPPPDLKLNSAKEVDLKC
ncbi:MauE/DoxX family redox-associated membrane protein [Thermodesulfobacteriota bacterium]